MTTITKRIIVGAVSFIVIFILAMTWFYPYSIFSLHKTYNYQPDPVMVDGYLKDVKEFKETFAKDLEEMESERPVDLTVERTQYVLPLFEQDWLISKDKLKMGKEDLDYMLSEVKSIRDTLLSMVEQGDYSKEQRGYLVLSIESLLSLEESIVDFQSSSFGSRKTLRIQFHNLHVAFMNNFMMFTTFYEVSQNEERAS
ncbi:hypothetical protein [Sediminibacillus albus]|uniref:Uncharacterized protein n=1 Tax=Sediminibacillus albus TaxID=407036 RepID=A0A1G9BD65_9BACI|nr:hypothetical protein [Sediminibacillus albus]SDK36785.1 hypothetical protein SAMN05216243_2928 [Sediminibacillus albus]